MFDFFKFQRFAQFVISTEGRNPREKLYKDWVFVAELLVGSAVASSLSLVSSFLGMTRLCYILSEVASFLAMTYFMVTFSSIILLPLSSFILPLSFCHFHLPLYSIFYTLSSA